MELYLGAIIAENIPTEAAMVASVKEDSELCAALVAKLGFFVRYLK